MKWILVWLIRRKGVLASPERQPSHCMSTECLLMWVNFPELHWPWPYCFTSTEATLLIRDRDRGGRGWKCEGSTADTAQKRLERLWSTARTMEVLRWCPLATAQWLVHCAIALSTAVLDRITKTMPVAPLLTNNLDNLKQKMSNLLNPALPPYSWSLLGKVEGPAPPPSSKISWSFDLAWNPV